MKRLIALVLELSLLIIFIIGVIFFIWVGYVNLQIDTVETASVSDVPGEILSINGYELHVQTFGDLNSRTPIMLLHDFDASGSISLMELARALNNQGYPIIVPDLLGFGFSERVTEAGEHYSHAGQAALLMALLDELGIQQVDLIGHSYGGAVAAQAGLDYPARVGRIALISADIYPEGIYDVVDIARGLPIGIGRAFTYLGLGGGSADLAHTESDCINCEVPPRNQYVLTADTTDALVALRQSTQNSDITEAIPELTVPVAVIWGADDNIIPLSFGMRLIEESAPSESVIIANGGHYPHQVNLSEVLETLVYFFSS